MEIGWRAQSYAADGGAAADGIRKQLGRPDLDLLTVLVRESAQNSWDARRGDQPVRFRLDLRTVGPAHIPNWRDLLARGIRTASGLPLRETLKERTIRLLIVSDRGTTGLGGPTRADEHAPGDRDFVSFIRNVGEARDKQLGGGTYGFGKGAFYLLARSASILVHTRTIVDGRFETRLIGCALWESYTEADQDGVTRPYTGRHWWGELASSIVEPLTGARADDIARALGLPSFEDGQTGTDIVVIDPDLDERTAEETAAYLAETIEWQLWPKVIAFDGAEPAMRFSVVCDGVTVPVRDPETTSPLSMFVRAYRTMRGEGGQSLACLKPFQDLGRLGLYRGYTGSFIATSASTMAGIEDGVHHVALMRGAELIVRYYPGPRTMSQSIGYAGVFKADIEIDDVYADAEPPTHDDWVPSQLDGNKRRFVNTTFTRINEKLEKIVESGHGDQSSSAATPLGAVSSLFSSLVSGAWGDGGFTDYGLVAPKVPVAEEPEPAYSTPGQNHADLDVPGLSTPQYTWVPDLVDTPNASTMPAAFGERQAAPMGSASSPSASGSAYRAVPTGRLTAARNPKIRYEGEPAWERRDGDAVILQYFTLPTPGMQSVQSRLAVALSDTGSSRETDPPAGAAQPVLLAWESDDGVIVTSLRLETNGGDGRRWRAVVRPAPDTLTDIALYVAPLQAVTQ